MALSSRTAQSHIVINLKKDVSSNCDRGQVRVFHTSSACCFGSARLPTCRPGPTRYCAVTLWRTQGLVRWGFVHELRIMRSPPTQSMPKSMVASSSSSTSRPSHGNDISWSGAERPSLPRLKRSGSFNRDLDPSLFTLNDDSPLASTSLSSSTGTSRRPSAKRQRNRQQLSCVACHLRKQACDKVVPCSRCIKAIADIAELHTPIGVAHLPKRGRSIPHVESLVNAALPVRYACGRRRLFEFSARTLLIRDGVSFEKVGKPTVSQEALAAYWCARPQGCRTRMPNRRQAQPSAAQSRGPQ
ncbi:BZ3500_MvSof-1268-A1-R1_Chr1-3g02303 [Microbotryum saponariae]|uniref:BZ3500_MvSof-1268-A1-R1_Chr1-3g02303 protein n=1 Tax=Microbotryum saponariae TaxID=289078 RepID=A0A2X0KUB1_9BASI|nr:BZ3500_MvSof-1268-A1-R1_Chr1-3g02303 [Microbotryum saponariae]SCZ95928.1 BZ3501_MvSof-1269-A2-R1_Chr1-3g01906 [Microbotryum saponariae]